MCGRGISHHSCGHIYFSYSRCVTAHLWPLKPCLDVTDIHFPAPEWCVACRKQRLEEVRALGINVEPASAIKEVKVDRRSGVKAVSGLAKGKGNAAKKHGKESMLAEMQAEEKP
ncbi:hypothetical protein B9Z65_2715 [Elsinoe australis]|uniref:Uncharacterized protein n=1 Tax=Elsinoe australis TaxID=40998 RepID=A0A2P8A4C3_9PEZI|nr:hypothetical protein B9Z65_2715 [Elsinoe australis]